jgi:hypothetical protein
MAPEGPEQLDFPHNWDRLKERRDEAEDPAGAAVPDRSAEISPVRLSMFAAAWADIVSITAVCTLALLALVGLGYRATVPAFPWAAALGLVWWCAAAAVTLVVRRGPPGMLMAGVVFADRLRPGRLPLTLTAALVLCASLGVLALLGARRSLLRLAAGEDLMGIDPQQAALTG